MRGDDGRTGDLTSASVTAVHRLSRQDARRIAVRAQLLDEPRPSGLIDVLRHLTMLQVDPTGAVAPSADLVLWSRLGSSYSPTALRDALEDHRVVELRAMLRPAEDIALYRAEMARWPGTGELRGYKRHQRDWVAANAACRGDILDRLRSSGPLTSRELPDTCAQPWASTGLERQQERGDAAGRDGAARRGRRCRTQGAGPSVGSRRPRVPRRPRRPGR